MTKKMKCNPEIHHRRSIRLKNYDYSQPGAYFVTIRTYYKKCLFGIIKDGNLELSPIGKIAQGFWIEIPEHFENVELDEFIVMPNHIHGIIIIVKCKNYGGLQNLQIHDNVGDQDYIRVQYIEPLQRKRKLNNKPLQKQNKYQHIITKSIGSIIRSYKSSLTRWYRNNGFEEFQWQRNYYEHIIRNDEELNAILQYIKDNPIRWQLDRGNTIFDDSV